MKQITRRKVLATASIGLAASIVPKIALGEMAQASPDAQSSTGRLNVLFFAVDDLRPQLGCYGLNQMRTPNIDRLAAKGMVFKSNYCQQAVCSPSRTSMLTGCRPDTTQVYDLEKFFRDTLPNVVTLPQHFKKHGYFAEAVGKVYHEDLNDPASWTIPAVFDTSAEEREQYQSRESYRQEDERGKQLQGHGIVYGPPTEAEDAPEENYLDARIAAEAILRLKIRKERKSTQPFFLAVGFHKPHLPFVAPKKYWDLYDPTQIELPVDSEKPKGAPDLAMSNFEELRHYYGVPLGHDPFPNDLVRHLIHGYYAGVSFTDAQIGRVVDALEAEGFGDNTIVVLVADHGWHLGDHGLWCKHTNFERATHVPMIIRDPRAQPGMSTALVENVDVYPSLCDMTGLPKPDHLEGTSLVPLLHEPNQPWKKAAFSQYPRGGGVMGYSMRTTRYRYTNWLKRTDKATVAEELYDYESDPNETENLAANTGYTSVLEALRRQSVGGWRAATPTGLS